LNGQGTKKTIHIGINVNRLAEELKKKSKFKEVRISFLEFCAPLFNEVLEKLVKRIMIEFL
jgi:sirohydrochlorin ferrochelatase